MHMNYQSFLFRELDRRKRKNPSYSLRAFARDLSVPAPKLSQILNNKCGLSKARGMKIAASIGLTPAETDVFLNLIESQHARSERDRINARIRLTTQNSVEQMRIDMESFKVISDWYHFSILELTEIRGFNMSHENIARSLGLDSHVVEQAIERLLLLGLLKKTENGYQQTHQNIVTTADIPSSEVREHHSQVIQKSLQSLHQDDVSKRDFSSITLAFNTEFIPDVKLYLEKVKVEFEEKFLKKNGCNSIYAFSYQFFPITQSDEKESLKTPTKKQKKIQMKELE